MNKFQLTTERCDEKFILGSSNIMRNRNEPSTEPCGTSYSTITAKGGETARALQSVELYLLITVIDKYT